jgi:hypothetical protein
MGMGHPRDSFGHKGEASPSQPLCPVGHGFGDSKSVGLLVLAQEVGHLCKRADLQGFLGTRRAYWG